MRSSNRASAAAGTSVARMAARATGVPGWLGNPIRGRFSVKHPATTGDPHFERIFRAHINTLEWMPTFLVPLWLCAIYLNDAAAAALGLIWVGGRVWYFAGYSRAVEKRLPGFFIQL